MLARTLALVLGIPVLQGAPASAGGDGYDAAEEAGSGPVFYGAVRDARGLGVADAEVTLRPKQGDPVTLKTNMFGLYRSHVAEATAPTDVDVTCGKPGYKQIGVKRRQTQNDNALETNCTLQRL